MSILVVGSVAYDDVETAAGRRSRVLGGAASYFSVAAAKYAPVRLCGVVGDDFSDADRARIAGAGVDLAGLERRPGRTFRWLGRYDETFGAAETINTDLGVFASWRPAVPAAYLDSELLFLANIDPEIQLAVRGQLPAGRFVALDTMNYWIGQKRDTLFQVLANVDLVCLNEGEIRQLCETPNVIAAARALLGRGPSAVVVKRAEHGATLFTADGLFWCPAYPVELVIDPTGAGDSFAGGLVGSLAAAPRIDGAALRHAVVEGSVCASFTVESFGIDRLLTASAADLDQRRAALRAIVDVSGTGVPFGLYEGH